MGKAERDEVEGWRWKAVVVVMARDQGLERGMGTEDGQVSLELSDVWMLVWLRGGARS